MKMKLKALIIVLAMTAAGLVAVWAILLFAGRRVRSTQPLPNPNGYDDIVRGGQMFIVKLDTMAGLDHESLKVLIITNAEPLRLMRMGLTPPMFRSD